MSVEIVNLETCYGCGACSCACPTLCISMCKDTKGFFRPIIDSKKCINCDHCETVCQVLHPISVYDSEPRAYACKSLDNNIRLNASSGGMFPMLAESFIDKGGAVVGAAFADTFTVKHAVVEDKESLRALYGSKYVQSDTGECYKETEQLLKRGIPVLFSGTPCQIEGLKCYLGKEYENLITMGVACHGAPSPLVWRKYLAEQEHKYGSKISLVNFRDKRTGWKNYSVTIEFENGKEYSTIFGSDPYMLSFLLNYSLRESCYHCRYKGAYRNSDITLADFWGIEKVLPGLDDDKGTSLVIIQSRKGEKLFKGICDKLYYQEIDIDRAVELNGGLWKSPVPPQKRGVFFDYLENHTFEEAYLQATKQNALERISIKLKRLVKSGDK